jgi:hypothetical protein
MFFFSLIIVVFMLLFLLSSFLVPIAIAFKNQLQCIVYFICQRFYTVRLIESIMGRFRAIGSRLLVFEFEIT